MASPAVRSSLPALGATSATGGAAATGSTAANSHDVTLPATIEAGDLLMVAGRVSGAGTVAVTGGGWTVVQDSSDASDDVTFYMWRDTLAAGTEDNSTITVTHGASLRMSAESLAISGADDPASRPPEASTVAVGTSTTPDPTAVTPSWGSADILVLWVGGQEGESTLTVASPPTNYTAQCAASTGTAGAVGLNNQSRVAKRALTASTENPGSWAFSVSEDWAVWAVAVPPPGPQTISGGVASEADSGPAGQVQQVYTASPGSESDSAPAGQAAQIYTAVPAAESDSVPAGTVDQGAGPQTVNGGVASEADSAPGGQSQQVYTAAPAAENDQAPTGKVFQVYTASPGAEQDSAPAGQVWQVYIAGVASETDAAVAGKVLQLYTAGPALESDSAPAGTVLQPVVVLGGVATEADSVPVGTVVSGAEPDPNPIILVGSERATLRVRSRGRLIQMSGFVLSGRPAGALSQWES